MCVIKYEITRLSLQAANIFCNFNFEYEKLLAHQTVEMTSCFGVKTKSTALNSLN